MKAYIMLDIRLRKDAKNELEKDFFELMNNSVFGKTMENIRNHKDMKLVTSDKKYLKYVMKPNFKDGHPFSKHLFAVEMGKREMTMNKPVYLGQTILDLSKTLKYEFLYDYMRSKYGSKVNLCYMDTDSFVYEVETEDFYRDIAKDVGERFDTSGYSKDDNRSLPIGKNKKVIDLIKDELGEKIMPEFVTLRVKMFAYRKKDCLADQHEHFVTCVEKKPKSVWFLKALRLMTIRHASLMVKQYTESKCCLRIRSMSCKRLISIR